MGLYIYVVDDVNLLSNAVKFTPDGGSYATDRFLGEMKKFVKL